VLPTAHPFTAADADRWVRAGVPRWVTGIALPGLWLCAIVVAFTSDTTRCTPQDPSVCGPDSHFALWLVVCLATPVLLWWMPVLGCWAGVTFALAELRYDDVQAARWAFGLHGLLCALVAVRLVRGSAEQRRIAEATSAGGRIGAVPDVPGGPGPSAVSGLAVAGLLVLAGLGFFAWYGHEVADEQDHLTRAVQVQAKILAVDPDWSIRVEARTPAVGTREYTIEVAYYTDPYPLHASTPVLVDPQDRDWVRLVAEPQDVTYWQTAGAGCFALAFCWLLQRQRWRRGVRALSSGEHPALRVRIRPDDKGRALILPALDGLSGPGGARPIGRLAVFDAPPEPEPPASGRPADAWAEADGPEFDGPEFDDSDEDWDEDGDGDWDHETQAAFGRTWRDEDPAGLERFAPPELVEDAVLIGELRDRGVAMLVTADAVLLPTGRLRAGQARGLQSDPPGKPPDASRYPLSAWWRRLVASTRSGRDDLFPGVAVDPAGLRQPPELPLTVRLRVRVRATGLLMLVAAFVGYPVLRWLAELHLFGEIALAVGLGRLAMAGVGRLFSYLRLEHSRFEMAGRWWTHTVPWDRLHGVRRNGELLSVAWQPDIMIDFGPFDDPAGESGRQDRAEQLGAAMLLLRQRALLGGLPGREAGSRPNLTWIVLATYIALVLFTLWRW
jgi:hypothetical protein